MVRKLRSYDVLCLAGGGIRAGYPSGKLMHSLSRAQRRRYTGRVVIALTADRFYALRHVVPMTRVAKLRRMLRGRWHFTIGRNTWYVLPGRHADGVMKVHRGRVEEVGVAQLRLLRTRRQARRFLASFN